ncbi:hypothetical protein J2T13_001034 [Paenibacillus sp. DS2015]|uniref:hypothetical protein n=1 Tax=Paenibacillus sp. DS2015 TaxID=3373917 RepID=UPI003D203D8A
MNKVLFESKYFDFWLNNVRLSAKDNVITHLRKFESFLSCKGFSGELDFDNFHGSLKYPGRFLPINEKDIDEFVAYLRDHCNSSKFVLSVI